VFSEQETHLVREALVSRLRAAQEAGWPYLDVRAGDLAQAAAQRAEIGASSLTVCSEVMRGTMGANDHLLAVPPRGCGPQLLIRYALPRTIPDP
jgi:hypothetical protein